MLTPPYTGNNDLDSFLYQLQLNGTDNGNSSLGINSNTTTGEITDSSNNVIGYLYQFIQVKYADSNTGAGLSNSPTNKSYYGIHNSTTDTESTNPADYTWYETTGTFGTTRFLYYYVLGGRQIKFDVNTTPIDYHWLLDSGAAINLDLLVPAKTITTSELMDAAVTELKIASAAVTASKTNIAAISAATGNLVTNSVGTTQITDDAITSQKIVANAIVAGKIAADAVTATNIQANAITANKISADAVTSDKIVANAITSVKIVTDAITADKIAAGSITTAKIAADAVTATEIAANAVTADKILANTITTDKLVVGSVSAANNASTYSNLVYPPATSSNGGTMTGPSVTLTTSGGTGSYVIVTITGSYECNIQHPFWNFMSGNITLKVDGAYSTETAYGYALLESTNASIYRGRSGFSLVYRVTGLSAGSHTFSTDVLFFGGKGLDGVSLVTNWPTGSYVAISNANMVAMENKV